MSAAPAQAGIKADTKITMPATRIEIETPWRYIPIAGRSINAGGNQRAPCACENCIKFSERHSPIQRNLVSKLRRCVSARSWAQQTRLKSRKFAQKESAVPPKASSWTPPFSLAERLKYTLVPPRLNMWRLIRKHLRKGEPELRFLPQMVPAGRNAVDVGANKGVYSHLLARLCPQVDCFEPSPKMYKMLTRYLPANVTPHRVALSDRAGVAELIVPLHTSGYSNQ